MRASEALMGSFGFSLPAIGGLVPFFLSPFFDVHGHTPPGLGGAFPFILSQNIWNRHEPTFDLLPFCVYIRDAWPFLGEMGDAEDQ